jgi:hypothetical protein
VSADPPDVDFVVADDPAGTDEDLPETADAPWWLRARVPLGVAAAVALLAALLFRVTSGGSDRRSPAAAAPSSAKSSGVTGPTVSIRVDGIRPGHRIFIYRIPRHTSRWPGCDVLPECIMSASAPDSVIAVLHELVPGAHVTFSRTTMKGTGIAGRHHRFESTTVVARRGKVVVRIGVLRTDKPPKGQARGGERETAFGAEVYANAYRDGYFISIDITAPTGHVPVHIDDVMKLAGDARLRP